MRVAVMQPYFIPYAGYFRLFHAVDLLIIYDCVQFARRGWVHRNRLMQQNGCLQWLTLPLKKADREIEISEIEFSDNCHTDWTERLRSFPQLSTKYEINNALLPFVRKLKTKPLEFITELLQETCRLLALPYEVQYSSSFHLPKTLKGQDRIIELVKNVGGREYVNLAGGRALYDAELFRNHNIKLHFLSEYQGSAASILERLANEKASDLEADIKLQTAFTLN